MVEVDFYHQTQPVYQAQHPPADGPDSPEWHASLNGR